MTVVTEVVATMHGVLGPRLDRSVLMQHSGPTRLAQEPAQGKRLARDLAATWVLPITD